MTDSDPHCGWCQHSKWRGWVLKCEVRNCSVEPVEECCDSFRDHDSKDLPGEGR